MRSRTYLTRLTGDVGELDLVSGEDVLAEAFHHGFAHALRQEHEAPRSLYEDRGEVDEPPLGGDEACLAARALGEVLEAVCRLVVEESPGILSTNPHTTGSRHVCGRGGRAVIP